MHCIFVFFQMCGTKNTKNLPLLVIYGYFPPISPGAVEFLNSGIGPGSEKVWKPMVSGENKNTTRRLKYHRENGGRPL